MNRLHHITIAIVCLVVTLPSSAFATCCCSAKRCGACCTTTDKSPACCCGKSLSNRKFHTSAKCSRCDSQCKCCADESLKAVIVPRRNNSDAAVAVPFYFFSLAISPLDQGFACLVWRAPTHNLRQAMLSVWQK